MRFLYPLASLTLVACLTENPTIIYVDQPTTVYVEKKIHIRDTIYIYKTTRVKKLEFGLTNDPQKDSIGGKAVAFYLNQPACSGLAKAFYYKQYRPTDDDITPELLKLAITENDSLRPFYLWCLNETIRISDGALSEYIGVPARKFIEKYPTDFFELMGDNRHPSTYKKWVSGIRYSGFYDLDKEYEMLDKFITRFEKKIVANCSNCPKKIKHSIQQLINDLQK